ncbi:hypothetical protein [Consotaella aegiceratis]|uniref:hypothetical protein n=1 Tax=Consotaella aegiceratis TaxID=3097961 RepID=UPI002F411624
MFKLFQSRKRKAEHEQLLVDMMRAAAEGENIARFRSAASMIGAQTSGLEGSRFVGVVSGRLARRLIDEASYFWEDKDAQFVAGLFAFVACNHVSYKTGDPFEESTVIAILEIVTPELERAADLHSEVVKTYNGLGENQPKLMQAIGQTTARWFSEPSDENLRSLADLFEVCVKNLD